MAPNRKQLVDVVDPLIDTTQLVQAKYLPLTTADEVAAEAAPSTTNAVAVDSDDYWYCPSDVPPTTVQDLFSATHLEANLIRESQQALPTAPATTTTRSSYSNEESDNYWAERVEARIRNNSTLIGGSMSSDDYWTFPNDDQGGKAVQIALLLKEEFARHQVSADTIEQHLLTRAKHAKNIPSKTKAENDSYWEWKSPFEVRADAGTINDSYWEWTTTDDDDDDATKKAKLIETILVYEANRHLFSAQHVQDNLTAMKKQGGAPMHSCAVDSSSDWYWTWKDTSCAIDGDDYWNMRPTTAIMATPKGYWDW